MIKFPQINWKQTNLSDILGSLWASFNLDLTDNLGVTKVSPRTLLINDDTTNMGIPAAFEFFDGEWWMVSTSRIFENDGDTDSAFTDDNSSGALTTYDSDYSDLELFNGDLYATADTTLQKKESAAGAWGANLLTLGTATIHLLLAFGARLYVTDLTSRVHSLSTADVAASPDAVDANTVSNTLQLALYGGSDKNTITCMKATTQYIWLGTLNRSQAGKGRVYYWDGAQPSPNGFVELDSIGVVAMVIKDDVPWIVDANGALLKWNGGTFEEVARLPYDKRKFLGLPFDIDNTDRFIHPNGIAMIDNRINMLVRNEYRDSTTSVSENLPSGIWEYDPNIGLYHKMSLSYRTFSAGATTDHGQFILPKVGAIAKAKDDNNAAGADGSMLIGAQRYSNATSTAEGIWIDNVVDNIQKFGYLVTTKIFSQNITDTWNKLFIRIKELLDSADIIWLKYRTEAVAATEATITWTSTTTCTTTTNVSAFIGYEMEVLNGTGGGKCSKITNVTESGGTYTITLQETFTGVTTGTAIARFQYWIEVGKFTNQNDKFFSAPIGESTPWIQFKICVQFTGANEIYDFLLINKPHQLAE